MTENHKNTKPP